MSPGLFNFYAEYIMWNASLDEAQAGIKIAGRNINNLRYADDTTLMAESKEELNSLLIKVKEKSDLKLNLQKKNIMASSLIIAWQILFSWAPKSLQMLTAAVKLEDTCSLEEKLWQTQTVNFRSRDIIWLTKVHLVKPVVFPGVRAWELDHKKGWA